MDVDGRKTTAVGEVTADRVTGAPLSITTRHRRARTRDVSNTGPGSPQNKGFHLIADYGGQT